MLKRGSHRAADNLVFARGSPGHAPVSFTIGGRDQLFVRAESLQLCPTLCGPVNHSPPGPSVRGILQARTLERAAISSCRRSSPPRGGSQASHVSRIGLSQCRGLLLRVDEGICL